MTKIKEPAVADSFYPKNELILKSQLNEFKKNNSNQYEYITRAVIVPHAGYIYSGLLAYEGISQLNKYIKNIFIFAPTHRVATDGIALSSFDEWQTPLGNIKVNQDINNQLVEKFGAKIYDVPHKEEHAIEVQIPIIQSLFEDVQIIPVLIGNANYQIITDIIKEFYNNKEFGFIISSDLSHFLNDTKAKKTDEKTAQMIESGNLSGFSFERACGATGICGLVNFASESKFSLIRINMSNSSTANRDKSRVVGYGCWFLYEGTKNNFLKTHYSDYMLELCRKAIYSEFSKKKLNIETPAVFNQLGASFVTLNKSNALRGCIGSIVAHQSLIDDLISNAKNSAFKDPRFNPIDKSELDYLSINISLLSNPEPISFKTEEELLAKIVPFKDGIIIKDGWKQAVYLPCVWQDLPDKRLFLQSLKMKAGMKSDHFSSSFEAYKFNAEYIEE